MELMQFSAIMLLTLLTLKLLLLPRKVEVNPVVGRARLLMTAGIILLDIQFLLQYTLGLRAMGVTQAVLVNLVLFMPSCWTISLAVLYLQRQGHISTINKWVGGITWAIAILLLGIAAATDGKPLFSDTPELHRAEIISSLLYLATQGHYSWYHLKNLRSIRHTLQDYYDSDMGSMLLWMQFSILVLIVLAIMVPLLIFIESKWLAIFGLLFFFGIFYMVDSFSNYVVSSAPKRMQEAEESTTISKQTTDSFSDIQRVEHAVEQWIAKGGYLQTGLKLPNAAEAVGVPQYQLSSWLRQQGLTYSSWMTSLRINEAKHMLTEHPDWNNEAIAQHCGFSDRTYFQKKFKEQVGCSPAEYVARHINA